MDRRRFLSAGGFSLTAAFLAACNVDRSPRAQRVLDFAEKRNEGVERSLFRHSSMDRAKGGAKLAGTAFPSYFISNTVPVWDEATRGPWTLEVTGAVNTPVKLSLEDLRRLPFRSQRVDHFCVEGWNAIAVWQGVRLSDIARLVGLKADAAYVDFQSFDDRYHESWDLDSAMHPQTLVVIAMDGHLLGMAHGAPARIHSPVKLGYKNTKYLTKIVFLPKRNGGYWSDQGYEWYGGT
ncbi:MAG: molybdopterin-dependent oxidoreductase [Gemmatimonadota bacterium]|nr:molybdopterin-dependent oxidoreductase [Gemmatimonadota bacterium]